MPLDRNDFTTTELAAALKADRTDVYGLVRLLLTQKLLVENTEPRKSASGKGKPSMSYKFADGLSPQVIATTFTILGNSINEAFK